MKLKRKEICLPPCANEPVKNLVREVTARVFTRCRAPTVPKAARLFAGFCAAILLVGLLPCAVASPESDCAVLEHCYVNQTITQALDPGSRLIERNYGNGIASRYQWLADGSLQSVEHRAGSQQTASHVYSYDPWGNRASAIDTLATVAQTSNYTYDPLDRLKSAANGSPTQDQVYGYDIFGNRIGKTIGGLSTAVTQSFTYNHDAAHQLTQVNQTIGTPVAVTLLRYDDNGNLKKLCDAGNGTVADASSGTDCSASGSASLTRALGWDGAERLIGITPTGAGGQAESYAYDDAGRRITKTTGTASPAPPGTPGTSTTHSLYDGADLAAEWSGAILTGAPAAVYAHAGSDAPLLRLSGASGTPDADPRVYTQDGLGSVGAYLTPTPGTTPVANQTGNGALTTSGDANPTAYPGSQLIDGVTTPSNSTGWVGAVGSGATATLTLAAAQTVDRVDLMAVSNYLPGAFVIETLNANSTWTQVADGASADFANNGDGSLRAVKRFTPVSTGAIRVRFTAAINNGLVWLTELQVWNAAASLITQRFDPWGNLTQSSGSIPVYGYTGREPDPSGFMFYRARYYSPSLGRFISRDPLGLQAGINPYAYVNNNPVNFNDPDGLLARQVLNWSMDYAGRVGQSLSDTVSTSPAANLGKAFGGLAAYGTGIATGDSNLADAAMEGLDATKQQNMDALMFFGTIGRGQGSKTFQTYTRTNPTTGEVYSGRTSGTGTPQQNLDVRNASSPLNDQGFNNAVLDRSSSNAGAIRGREQQLIDQFGGARSQGGNSANKINGVSPNNPNGSGYLGDSLREFGKFLGL